MTRIHAKMSTMKPNKTCRAHFLTTLVAGLILLSGCAPGEDVDDVLAPFAGHVLFINYWAEWCAPCREEIPALNAFQRDNPDIRVLGVNFDRVQGEVLADQVQKLGVDFPTLAGDPRQRFGLEPVTGLPETLVIDGDGKLVAVMQGPQTLESLQTRLDLVRQSGDNE